MSRVLTVIIIIFHLSRVLMVVIILKVGRVLMVVIIVLGKQGTGKYMGLHDHVSDQSTHVRHHLLGWQGIHGRHHCLR